MLFVTCMLFVMRFSFYFITLVASVGLKSIPSSHNRKSKKNEVIMQIAEQQWHFVEISSVPVELLRDTDWILSRSGPGFDPRSGQVSWVWFFRVFSTPVSQISGSFRPPRSPNIIWPSLLSWIIIHYGRQWPEMLTRPETSNMQTYK